VFTGLFYLFIIALMDECRRYSEYRTEWRQK